MHTINLFQTLTLYSLLQINGRAFLFSVIVAAVAIAEISTAFVVVNTEAHPVCAGPCDYLYPCPTVIKPCLAPLWPAVHDLNNMVIVLAIFTSFLIIAIFAIRRHLKRKDFYEVRYRGG
jgi:hypothetical protein